MSKLGVREEGTKVCAQFVPNSGALERIPAHSSAPRRRTLLFRPQAVTHTYTDCGLGLKILCSSHWLATGCGSLSDTVIMRQVADVSQWVRYCSTGTTTTIAPEARAHRESGRR